MLYNDEILPPLSLRTCSKSIKNLLDKLLSLRRIEFVAVDRELKIQETSLNVQEFADIPNEIEKGKDVRDSFPELIGIEELLDDIIEQRQPSFQLNSVTRVLTDGSYLYLDLYIFGQKEQLKPERLIIFCENVTDTVSVQQSMVQAANENSIKVDYLANARDYIDQILDSINDILLVTTESGKIKKVNKSTQQLFGYTESELIDKPISMIAADEELLRQVSQLPPELKNESWHQVKVACTTKKGSKLTVAFSCSTIQTSIESKHYDNKSIQNFVCVGRDITEEQRIKKRQAAQYAVARIMSESGSLESTTPKILQAICDSLGWDVGELWTPVDEKETKFDGKNSGDQIPLLFAAPDNVIEDVPFLLRVGVWWRGTEVGEFVENSQQINLEPGAGLPGIVWNTGFPQWITDILKDRNFVRSHLAATAGLRSAFGFPIRASGQIVGVMTFFAREKQPPDEDLLQMMAAVGSQLGQFVKRKYAEQELQEAEASIRFLYQQEKRQSEELAHQNLALEQAKLELERANMELQRLASVDGLTQIANRRCFDKTLELQWQWMEQEKEPLSLILCDIDFFKLYNDRYGHQGGDECLKQVAEILNSNAQQDGYLAARYGGEEFAVILPRTDMQEAMRVAKSIRSHVKAATIFHAASKVSKFVSLSIGIFTAVPAVGLSIEGLIGEADRALYRAKLEGRDRIVCLQHPV
ncbi:diguanylate cyclase [Microcoleus sp. LEGE 07076]|uniref:diguanylate cyclase domain-containing protein n=1 Tax=Microcoleus sp. LEGE 07076 TaxID=915322 RepID=UPI00187DF2B2|nr:diguanylate cyclase [Microcoleus sp. LEGE 07076]MBE9185022.1 diguanylate cyclase [Microcoleus sp. LEGE 07076]